MRLLLVTPQLSLTGGVASHYAGLHNYWTAQTAYCTQGHRHRLPAWFWLFPDYITFIFRILVFRPDTVIINPSLRTYMLFRDGLYLLIAKAMRQKVVCFFHGWDIALAGRIKQSPQWFNKTFGLADLTYVLCSDYRKTLEAMRFPSPVKLTTTKVEDTLLADFDLICRKRPVRNLLWVARVDRNKGIFVAIDAFANLITQRPDLHFTIVGNGCDENAARQYVKEKKIPNIVFKGSLRGEALAHEFTQGDIYILPSYFEGMATSVLEAMAFGLPVITTPVGGTKDFFINRKMGFLINGYDPKDYADALAYLVDHPDVCQAIARYNYAFAKEHFMASSVAKRIEEDVKQIIS